MKRSLKKIAGFGGGYRRISPSNVFLCVKNCRTKTYSRGYSRELVFTTGDFVSEKLGGLP